MNQADKQYKEIIESILTNGYSDENEIVRTKWKDGTPAHTKSIFGKQIVFNEGEIPILTGKKVFWKTALKEILLFWQKQTTLEKDFHNENVHIWDEWFKDGNIGRSYAYQFESHRHHNREIVKVKPRIKEPHDKLKPIVVGKKEAVNKNCKDELCGIIIDSQNSGKYIVLDVFSSNKDNNYIKMAKVQFLETNYTVITTKDNAKKGKVKDIYARRVKGVGYEGDVNSVKNYTKDEISKLRARWNSMLGRCYDKNNNRYSEYGGRGIFVDERWHSFENYLRDIRYLPQFFLARENGFDGYQLDKDYYGSNCYSKDTCVWIKTVENNIYKYKPFNLIHPNGDKELFLSIADAERKYKLNDLSPILANKVGKKSTKGFRAKYINDEEHLYRYELSRNQVVELLHNIKNNPSSRRLMASFWNYADVDKKNLQECAWATNWCVRDGKLDLILIQRSVDVALGLPFNWIQYYFLQCMIAHVSGLKVGKFIHQMGNVHYYDRHEDKLIEQINKTTYKQPKLWINPEVKNFYDFTIDDFKLIDYRHGETINFEVAI